jgi:diguanylate cyclase (GGDEF)-like protein/PAS domain S-box-containing protein
MDDAPLPRSPSLSLRPTLAVGQDWDLLPAMLVALDARGHALAVNRAFVEASGWPAPRLLGGGWLTQLDAGSRSALLAWLGAVPASGPLGSEQLQPSQAPAAVELQFTTADDRRATYTCLGQAQATLPGQAPWVLCTLHDVTGARAAAHEARLQASQLRLLADNVPALIAYYDRHEFRCRFANRRYAQAFGWREDQIVGLTAAEIVGETGWAQVRPHIEAVVATERQVSYERELRDAEGQPLWIEVDVIPHLSEAAVLLGAFVLVTDITKHRLAERAVRESEERLAKFMQASVEGIVFHRDGIVLDVNDRLCELAGCERDEMIGRRTTDFLAPEQAAKAQQILQHGTETAFESVGLRKDGERIPVECITRSIQRHGENLRLVIVRDIRERLAAQARIHHLAHHDALTGLPNRAAFVRQLEQLSASHRAGDAQSALLFIDLDHFKRVNDSLGHLAGDALLCTVTARIKGCLRAGDAVARFGGDEFMVLLAGVAERDTAEQVAVKLLAAVEAPVELAGRAISVSPSIGVALFPEHGRTPTELIQHADLAMYLAKSRGRANVQFFDPTLANAAYDALVLEDQVAQSLEHEAFELHFQPQRRAHDGRLVGAEALLRWRHPQRGMLRPDAFLPVIEDRRLMLPLGLWVLREALRCAKRWRAQGLALPVAVNLSSMQFQQRDFVDALVRLLAEEQAEGAWLELELTERMLMDDLPDVKARLALLKQLGVRLAVDDFGTGYSSLGHLKELPIDKVKIDRSFVQDLPGQRDARAIARAIVQLGHSLGLGVIAEGVENGEQARLLCELGCDELQGLHIGAPMPAEAFERWAAEHA